MIEFWVFMLYSVLVLSAMISGMAAGLVYWWRKERWDETTGDAH